MSITPPSGWINNPIANAVSAQFDSRPTLATVARQLFAALIAQDYPTLSIDLDRTQLATPHDTGWTFQPLMPRVLDFLASGAMPDFSARAGRASYLSDQPPLHLKLPDEQPLAMSVLEGAINTLAWTLPAALQNSLAGYWGAPGDTGVSRWRWLSDVLIDAMNISASSQADLSPREREMLDQLVDYPDREVRATRFGTQAVHAYVPHATLKTGRHTRNVLGPELMVVCSPHVLLCQPGGPCERYTSVDSAAHAWSRRVTRDEVVEHITLSRFEPDGHLFDTQAATLLNQPLQALNSLVLPAGQNPDTLQSVYREISDPALGFLETVRPSTQVLETLRNQAPDWLRNASAAARARYRHYSLKLARAKTNCQGRTFLSDIPDIRSFTHSTLLTQLTLDQQRFESTPSAQVQPEDVQLTFSGAAGYPGGAGFVDKVHMSLADLAINNLQGQPRGQLSLALRSGRPLPAWLTPDYIHGIGGLIQRVDIGKTYPELLKQQLLDDNHGALQREQDFAAQTAAQLPLQALELSLKREQGFTDAGAAYIQALMQNDPLKRRVDDQPIVIRHLALVRKPHAAADLVANMYIIEADRGEVGPHILYRPLYAEALQQFASRQALLEAIASPGELQASVLTWLSHNARPIYDNGGFQQPHYVRHGLGDEFSPSEIPAPAALAVDGASDELLQFLANGRLMQYLYGCNARALIDQADRETVSNSESRWKVFMEGAGLLFNTLLLPLARGPFMLVGWLLSVIGAASRDIPGLNSQDPTVRKLALADLLLNVGLLMFQWLPPATPAPHPAPADAKAQALRSPFSRRLPEQWPQPPEPQLQQGPVLLDSEGPGLSETVFDFSFSSAHNQLTATQQARLWRMQAPKPATAPQAVLNGPRRGLYYYLRDWYAVIDNRWYQVRLEPEGNVVIVDPFDTHRLGPHLKSNDQGHWSLDLRLRLRGGMPPKRIAAARERKAQRTQHLIDEQERFLNPSQTMRQGVQVAVKSQQQALQDKVKTAEQLMNLAARDPKYADAARANTRRNFDKALNEQTAAYANLLDSRQERRELGIPLPDAVAVILLENTVRNARKTVVIGDMDRQALYAAHPDLTGSYDQALPAVLANPARYAQFLKDMSQINERQIAALELKDRNLLELYRLGEQGLAGYNRLTDGRPDELSALSLKYLQLQNLKYLSKKHWQSGLINNELDLALEPLARHVRTHSELNNLNLSTADRLDVLDSLFEHYGQAVDALQGIGMVHADQLDMAYFQSTQALVESLYQDVVQQLAAEIKPVSSSQKRPPKRALTHEGKPQKKVIRTRKQGFLIGDLKLAGSTLPIDVVELRSEQDDRLLATYSQHEHRWDEVREQRRPSQPELPPGTRALNVVKGEARKRLKALTAVLQREEGYARISRFPVEIQESLDNQATGLGELASELERAIDAQPKAQQTVDDRTLASQLRGSADTLSAKGRTLRTQRTLELAPTDSHLAYLLEHNQVQLASLGPRLEMRGERSDFIQEYAVNDKRGYPLWYAHFHYPKADTPKLEYTVAHLKTKAQRRDSYYSLLARAQSPQSVVDVHRGAISRELAERWFLSLIP